MADPTLVNAIISNPAGWYFNVHSTLNPTGAVRGQLVRQ
ncbi:MAG: CHRD domain-containing protein [Acidobacteria bacterium]|nr:CHRD domain-containing protein [Acidobacteriota bacterium]